MDFEALGESILQHFSAKNAAREMALAASRELVRSCANTIRAAHRGDFERTGELLTRARDMNAALIKDLEGHQDLYHAGYVQDAQKEYAEASIFAALVQGRGLPGPVELHLLPATYMNGLGEAVGELRRYVLDTLRTGRIGDSEAMLGIMDDVYGVLVTIDYPDGLTGGLRRTTDMVRGVLERTRGDLTMALRQRDLEQAIHSLETKLGQPGEATAGCASRPELP